MNKLIALTLFFGMVFISFGQVQVPALSPEAELEQTIGLTEVEIEYSRPSMRGREIFGELIPYGELWRTGANKNTTISFSSSVKVQNQKVEAGEYAIFTKPGEDVWIIYLYKDTDNWGVPDSFSQDKVVATLKARPVETDKRVETFTMQFEDIGTDYAILAITWEKTRLALKFKFPTDELTQKSIDETMSGDSITERDYYGAASYYLNSKKNLDKALSYIDEAIGMRDGSPYWYLRKKALIEYELGNIKQAIKTAEASMKSAEKAGNKGYVKMNEESINEWKSE